jgi:hypothetical protein
VQPLESQLRAVNIESEINIMSNKPITQQRSKIAAAQPTAIPMPSMTASSKRLSPTSDPKKPADPSFKIGAMEAYPKGRGGMQAVSTGTSAAPVQARDQPAFPIGARPPAGRMPE